MSIPFELSSRRYLSSVRGRRLRRRSGNQLVLDLARSGPQPPLAVAPQELLQALADLLLEALGNQNNVRSAELEAYDATQDHALGTPASSLERRWPEIVAALNGAIRIQEAQCPINPCQSSSRASTKKKI